MKTCSAWCVAENFSFGSLKETLSSQYRCSMYRDVLHINDHDRGDAFIFSYGVLVVWGMTLESMEVLFKKTKPFEEGKHQQTFTDELTFLTKGTIGIKDDVIFLASDDVMEKLAISHGIAQSVKLQEFEIRAQSTIE